ncbi:tripartite tricarboxylate transporter substrate-binding protein [Bordetella holmesii]|uniref:tripartite tricarboxylate transporter substrate-binding protein n=1 Tax=Bordetella holmesii TaxID=35814 RepID=UPI0014644DD2|nr:tripartite tricarboxylate transporter substrate-binding protein [Bordetella holmesii]QJP52106.1 ABC transporter substrate-binding protein [Bordetella holmesii]
MFVSMSSRVRRRSLSLLACTAAAAIASAGWGKAHTEQAYPVKPIKLVVPFAPGGSTDIVVRVVAEGMRGPLGQSVIVENKAGAGSLLGTENIAQAAPDGYTIGMSTVSTATVNPGLFTRAAKLEGKLQPVAKLVSMPSVYMTNPQMGATDFQTFLGKTKEQPGQYSAAVPGLGSLGHLMMAALNDALKIDLEIVPYRGSGPALNDVLGGTVQVMADQLPSAMPHIKGGKLVPFALAAEERSADLPTVPTFKELGYPELNDLGMSWFGLVVPAGTPQPVVRRLQDAALESVRSPAVQERLKSLGAVAVTMDQAQFPAQIAAELQRNKALLNKLNVKPE